jgi:hypothetical protein
MQLGNLSISVSSQMQPVPDALAAICPLRRNEEGSPQALTPEEC